METIGILAPMLLQEIASHILLADLVVVNGPILSLYKDREGSLVIYDWCDQDEQFNRWACYRVSEENFDLFVKGKISLRSLQQGAIDGWCFVVDFDSNWRAHSVSFCQLSALPKRYIPRDDYFYDLTPRVYKTFHDLADSRTAVDWVSFETVEAIGIPTWEITLNIPSRNFTWSGSKIISQLTHV